MSENISDEELKRASERINADVHPKETVEVNALAFRALARECIRLRDVLKEREHQLEEADAGEMLLPAEQIAMYESTIREAHEDAARLREENQRQGGVIESAYGALGLHPDSSDDIAQLISDEIIHLREMRVKIPEGVHFGMLQTWLRKADEALSATPPKIGDAQLSIVAARVDANCIAAALAAKAGNP